MTTYYDVSFRLSRRPRSVGRARAAAHAVLADWGAGEELLGTAALVLSELVTNALRVRVPSDRQVGVRIAYSSADGLLRLEVSDAGSGRPEVRHPEADETEGRGLWLVEALSHRWGVSPRAGGIGKTVWCELKAPDLLPAPRTRELAAIAVRPGQEVRAWGAWRAVRSVSTVRHATGGLAVLLGLDGGPPLRVPAAEPLAVRGLP
ncbi:ATP-binding protein [Streptomyces sp. APSN-46.1]|uniref:ATP-binding protein n=1 Tax=Streptomyces sp. APSN-46.1 TaxID=2929049 RepID=UPI001FB2DBBA|nr:ATP-binding protein [Streptomyces sp. APSN-46.1]MCJ1680775.1 ATP-binding protein [Streptomyces sp. APSN-46.1]